MAEMKVEKHWVDGPNLFVKVSCSDRETLTSGIRQFVASHVADPVNNLGGWSSNTGVEKCECPIIYDPDHPEVEDPTELSKQAAAEKREIKWMFSQVAKLTRGV